METVIGMTAIAVALMIGLGALGAGDDQLAVDGGQLFGQQAGAGHLGEVVLDAVQLHRALGILDLLLEFFQLPGQPVCHRRILITCWS